MRKTRLVILPTKCLHQMGFLLLFLSCPVIGDWGRIRPESENSHNAIQIQREGTCGLERDPPGGFLSFLNDSGSKQCRLSEDPDPNIPSRIQENISTRRTTERQIDLRRIAQLRNSERRHARDVRSTQRRTVDERRETNTRMRRDIRSRSVESRRLTARNNIRARSLSPTRLETERAVRSRSLPARAIRQDNRRQTERLHLARRTMERQTSRRVDRDLQNERATRTAERRERETTRYTRTEDNERRDTRRSTPEASRRRENDKTRIQARERTETVRERRENRLSLGRRELNDGRRMKESETRRVAREPENDRRVDNRRLVPLSLKQTERRQDFPNEGLKSRRYAITRHDQLVPSKNTDDAPAKWIDLTTGFETFKTADWTTNCVIGAMVYYLTTRQQVKAV